MTVTTKLLSKYMDAGLNIIITGQAGTGKTTMLEQASKQLGWKMKYYSTPTLDVFSDLIGIPIPNHGRKSVDYYRPRELDEADVVFFDELNRGDMMVLNAVFEIIQFRSLNGEKLDRLKCCVAAVNPVVDGYTTRKLDLALLDRFDLQLESEPNPSWEYFRGKYGESYAKAGFFLYREYQQKLEAGEKLAYFSPRRLDKLMSIFQKFPVIETIRGVVNDEYGVLDFNRWGQILGSSLGEVSVAVENDVENQIHVAREMLKTNLNMSTHNRETVFRVCHMALTGMRPEYPILKRELMANLNRFVTGPEELSFWRTIIKGSTKEEIGILINGWPEAKRSMVLKLV